MVIEFETMTKNNVLTYKTDWHNDFMMSSATHAQVLCMLRKSLNKTNLSDPSKKMDQKSFLLFLL